MSFEAVSDALLDNKKVANVVHVHTKGPSFMGRAYKHIVSCQILVNEHWLPIHIGISEEWEQRLIDIYIDNYEKLPYMPHVEKDGKLCLYDLEGILIDADMIGILGQCLDRAIEIISQGLQEENKQDFIEEFSSYWNHLRHLRELRCIIPNNHVSQKIKFSEKTVGRRAKRESYSAYRHRSKSSSFFAAVDPKWFSIWEETGTQRNGLYIFHRSSEWIYPPDIRKDLDIAYVNEILRTISLDCTLTREFEKQRTLFIVFHIEQPNGVSVCFGVYVEKAEIEIHSDSIRIKSKSDTEVYPLSINRIDKGFLINRTKDSSGLGAVKKCLLIGCGSIGGYLINELIKSGIEDITLVDNDCMKEENIFRHFLGVESIGKYKADALADYFSKSIPYAKLQSIDESIREAIENGSVDLAEYDVIISATGNHNINRWLNNEIYRQRIKSPIFYVWNEPLDLGCHVAIVKLGNGGCYECIFKRDPLTNNLYDASAYVAIGERVVKNYSGCGGSFIPYSSSVSVKAASLCMDYIGRVLDGRCLRNVIVSLKNDGYYYIKQGLKVSELFERQETNSVKAIELICKECDVCG